VLDQSEHKHRAVARSPLRIFKSGDHKGPPSALRTATDHAALNRDGATAACMPVYYDITDQYCVW
jgi:hypothetical protein